MAPMARKILKSIAVDGGAPGGGSRGRLHRAGDAVSVAQREAWVVLGLLVLAVATRWPLRGTSLEEVDSVGYALAVEEINLDRHWPHPPGYIFFVWTTRLAQTWTGDAVGAVTAVNTLAGVLSVALLYALLRITLPMLVSLLSVLLYLFSAQVWFQHVRPMEDSYAFAWMLAAAYPLVRSARGSERSWLVGLFLVGLAGGAKQIVPFFLSGLCAGSLLRGRFPERTRLAMAGLLAAVCGVLFWLVPLAFYAGSVQDYLSWALSQVAWQRREAVSAADLSPHALWERARLTFALIWAHEWLAWPLLALGSVGAWEVVTHRREREWLLWLVVPTLALRFLFLGAWMRFSIYYLPFLLALAVCGIEVLAGGVSRAIGRSRLAPTVRTGRALQKRSALAVIGLAFVLAWAILQTVYILPTLVAIRRARAPMAQAMEFVAQRYDPNRALILIPEPQRTVYRLAQFYVAPTGFDYERVDFVTVSQLRARPTVLLLQSGPVVTGHTGWTGGAERRGRWQVEVPHWQDLSQTDEPWRIDLFEVHGSLLTYRNWHWEESGIRWAEVGGSTVVVSHAPARGMSLRFTCGMAATPQPPQGPAARFVLNRRHSVEWDGRGDGFTLRVPPEEVREGRVRVDVRPNCATTVADAHGRATAVGCVYVRDIKVIEEPAGSSSAR
jgi:4-amino-4-deoxy-L-arabinose transferase-like glycosyltransferase